MAAQKGRTSPEFYFSSIIEETCGTKVCEDQKQNMENTMLDLLKICQQKELYCIHDNVEDLIESALNSKLLLINLNSQRLNKEEHEVKNIAEPTAKHQTRITSCLRISMLSSIVILSGESKVQRIENKAKTLCSSTAVRGTVAIRGCWIDASGRLTCHHMIGGFSCY
ncbi:hypothetical protein Tco_0978373 [Tanacetum coccineum]|uniref:Uncharacterized protein n=1 Tax=Tanacetum coccineum TaxID=301880 RepID=A0ABQ5EMS1_9ASTR